jgi:hypothetical protein
VLSCWRKSLRSQINCMTLNPSLNQSTLDEYLVR